MDRFENIVKTQTCISREEVNKALVSGATGLHESLTRAFHILELTKEYLEKGVPPDVMLEIIKHLENKVTN